MARRNYTEADRREAAMALLIHDGSTKTAARHLGIPRSTLQLWQKREDWEDTVSTVRDEYEHEYEQKLIDRFDRLVDSAQAQLADRLEHGDSILDKNNTLIRRPMSGKDVSVTVGICLDKRQLLRNMPTSIQGNADERLQKLLDMFEQAGQQLRNRLNEKVIEADPIKSDAEKSVQSLFSVPEGDVH